MTDRRQWGESEDTQLRALHGQGLPARQIAIQMEWGVSSVSRRASRLGLAFDRSTTAAATQAAKQDAKARQAALELDLLGDIEQARLKFEEIVTMRDFQAFGQGLDAVVRAYVNFKRAVPDDGGLEEAQGLVGRILAAVSLSVEGLPRLNPTAPRAEG